VKSSARQISTLAYIAAVAAGKEIDMGTRRVLIALTGAAVIAAAPACGMSSAPHQTASNSPSPATTFAITDDAVIFFIGQGMWLAEVAGPQQVSVPRAELASILA